MTLHLATVDYLILAVYFTFVLGIGFALKRYMKTSSDFFLSGRAIPAWICGLAFISANLGAQEVIGMAASGAKYGIMTSHFYWVGAIPAMVFVGIFMMPFYYGSKARSVPEYLKLRFDEKTRAFNAVSFAVMTVFSSGISMHALAQLLEQILGFNYDLCIVVSAVIVLAYIFLGGLTSAIYNEVLQFFMIVFGFLPLVWLGLKSIGGWDGLVEKLNVVSTSPANPAGKVFEAGAWTQSWTHMGSPDANPMGVEWFGMVFGLGFVLSFAYWCTDFLVVQRAMAADSMSAARRTPLIAAVPKMLFPLLVILPGMIGIALHCGVDPTKFHIPVEAAAIAEKMAAEKLNLLDVAAKDVTAEQKAELKQTAKQFQTQLDSRQGRNDPALQAARAKWEARIGATDRKRLNYNMVIPALLQYYLPSGLLGLCLTGLMASFMSGMAGNVTAFNTVWTYDLYQSYVRPGQPDQHYLRMGHVVTVVGILISVACAYAARSFNNIMDMLQLVFGLVNAPLLATFLLGMFWRRCTGHGAFFGLLAGTVAAALHHGLTLPLDAGVGIKGGWLVAGHAMHTYQVEMAQNFWAAIYAFGASFVVTIVVSLLTPRLKTDDELRGLVYSLTPRIKEHGVPWYRQPATLGCVVLIVAVVLNVIFR
jgi:solute:Na+ symporter, SSS family